jgi:hypothetical protein
MTELLDRLSARECRFEEQSSIRTRAKLAHNMMLCLGKTDHARHPCWEPLGVIVAKILEDTRKVEVERRRRQMSGWRRR